MSNLKNTNYRYLKLRVDDSEYWDFYVYKDSFPQYNVGSDELIDRCLVSNIDWSKEECLSR